MITVLWSDAHLAVVDKPGGLLVHRSEEAPDRDVLLQRVARHFGTSVHAVQRLDRAASGAIVFAMGPEAARGAQEALAASDARKEYTLLVRGQPAEHWVVDRPLTDERGIQREAKSEFWRVEQLDRCAVLRARTYSGRRHQLRRHLAHCAHQVLGDTTHGKGRINRLFREIYALPRLFLHAAAVEFVHPFTDERLRVEAPLPADLGRTLELLRAAGGGDG